MSDHHLSQKSHVQLSHGHLTPPTHTPPRSTTSTQPSSPSPLSLLTELPFPSRQLLLSLQAPVASYNFTQPSAQTHPIPQTLYRLAFSSRSLLPFLPSIESLIALDWTSFPISSLLPSAFCSPPLLQTLFFLVAELSPLACD